MQGPFHDTPTHVFIFYFMWLIHLSSSRRELRTCFYSNDRHPGAFIHSLYCICLLRSWSGRLWCTACSLIWRIGAVVRVVSMLAVAASTRFCAGPFALLVGVWVLKECVMIYQANTAYLTTLLNVVRVITQECSGWLLCTLLSRVWHYCIQIIQHLWVQ